MIITIKKATLLLLTAAIPQIFLAQTTVSSADTEVPSGSFNYSGGKYTGQYIVKSNGICVPHGNGIIEWSETEKYVGEFNNGIKEGTGTYLWDDGQNFTGLWKNNVREGYGKLIMANGEQYEGEWHEDQFNGLGTYKWPKGQFYIGDFKNGERHNGVMYSSPEIIIAIFSNGEWNYFVDM